MKKDNDMLVEEEIVTEKRRKKKTDSEETMSLTRELKFKELQDKIDEEEADRIVEEAIKSSRKKAQIEAQEEVTLEEIDNLLKNEKKTKKTSKKNSVPKEEVEDISAKKKSIEDDLYLTSSFKPLKKRFKVKNVFWFFFKLIFAVVLLGAFVYFIIFPILKYFENCKPKAVFDNSLDYVQEHIDVVLDSIYVESDVIDYELSLNLDSNIEDYKGLIENTYIFKQAFDPENGRIEGGLFIKSADNKEYGYTVVQKDNAAFYNFSTSKEFYKDTNVDDYDETLAGWKSSFDANKAFSKIDAKYYFNTYINVFKKLITDDLLTVGRETIEVDGISVDVNRNSLELDKKKIIELEKAFNKEILKNERFLEIEARLLDKSVEEVKESYKEVSEYGDDYSFSINIYTVKGNKFAGFDIEENGFRNIYYYSFENKFEVHLNLTEDEECLTGGDCLESDRFIIDLIGTKKNNLIYVDVYYNDDDIGNLEIVELSAQKIDLDYKIIISDIVYEGDFVLGYDKENIEYEMRFSLEFNDEYVGVNGTIKYNLDNNNIGFIEDNRIVDYVEDDFVDSYERFYDTLDKEGLYDSFLVFESIIDMLNGYGSVDDSEESESNQSASI